VTTLSAGSSPDSRCTDRLPDTTRLCIHTITTKPWPIEVAIEQFAARGVTGITVWRQSLEGRNPAQVARHTQDAGLEIVSLCRGGFFPASTAAGRQSAVDDNLRAIDEAAALGAPTLVLVCGAVPGQPLPESRRQIRDGLLEILPHARACHVKLAVEPLHPVYADDRSAINTLRQANDLCDELDSFHVGVVVDVYHLWWDPDLSAEIARSGNAGRILAFHVSDWRTPTVDILNDRGVMGEGCIPIRQIRGWVEARGFAGHIEVEIFSDRYWSGDQPAFLDRVVDAYLNHV
jgi:sugar phosphate isomerase/epimerase